MTDERRDEERVPVSLEVQWEGMTSRGTARVSDINTGGCYIDTYAPASVGEMIVFKVRLGSDDWLELRGEVVSYDQGVGFGVRFRFLTDEEFYTLSQLKSGS